MIGKHLPSPKSNGSFGGLNDYITGKSKRRLDTEKVALVGCVNLISTETATTEMESLALQNKRCADPVMHLLLSWRENESPTKKQVEEAVKITLGEMSLSECQAVYALHQNTDNIHLHICVNRINPNTLRAVNPAHGWTRRGMERAARKIEHAQGWQTENNTWSEVNERGEIVRKAPPTDTDKAVPQKIQDMENLTGEQSAIRQVQNAVKEKLEKLSTWEDFYNLLSLSGMKYQKKGSGAVITVGDMTVKASDVSRNLTLSKLEKRLGPYCEIHRLAEVIYDDKSKNGKPKPLDDANKNNENWNAYVHAKFENLQSKKDKRLRLSMTQQEERTATRNRQKEERQALAGFFGSGVSRQTINRQRSILATRHAYERAVLKGKHQRDRKELQSQSKSFISYEQWLRNRNLDEEAEKWRHRKNKRILLLEAPDSEAVNKPGECNGLSGFSMTTTSRGVKFTSQNNPEAAAFVDVGRVIKVYDQSDDSLLAALQLAQQKWGGVQLNGTDEYKRRCAEMAARSGIRIVNPELQEDATVKLETPEERAQRAGEIFKALRSMAFEIARKHFPQGMIIMFDAQEGKTHTGPIIGTVVHEGQMRALQVIAERHVIMHRVTEKDMPQLECTMGHDVVITREGGNVARIVSENELRQQRRVGRGR